MVELPLDALHGGIGLAEAAPICAASVMWIEPPRSIAGSTRRYVQCKEADECATTQADQRNLVRRSVRSSPEVRRRTIDLSAQAGATLRQMSTAATPRHEVDTKQRQYAPAA